MPIGHLHRPIGLLSVLLAGALAVRSDEPLPSPQHVIAFVGIFAEADDPSLASFSKALARAWPGGLPPPVVQYHAGGDADSVQLQAALLAASARRPSVLVLPSGDAAKAARRLGTDPPVVFASYPDPVTTGIVESLRRPGRQTTGVWLGDTLNLKRLELLKDAFPRVRTVAMLADTSWLSSRSFAPIAANAERLLGLRLVLRVADTPESLEAMMNSEESGACDAWYIPPTYIAYLAEARIIAHLRRMRLPAIHSTPEEVEQGALMAYSQDTRFAYDAMARLVVRVALGEDASSIPVQRPYRYTLSVRVEPDAPWGHIAPSVLRRADRVYGQ